ncbi:pucR family transcriptional regulator [Planomonospora sphaerica]|uniref:PucR family transcriptional regulator n=1 Tax=Planomonospora sphaerica TaxID=161355 RepID=A0A161MF54_9ACTN|nr:PucR family transcriptional regulator [Planomonospora sphaerica]GAT70903.1 pucR family transcriptional regulator [Planomonospora sphaerica]
MDGAARVPADLLGGHPRMLSEAAATGRLPGREALDGYRAAGARAAELGLPLRELVDAALGMAEPVVSGSSDPGSSAPGASGLRGSGSDPAASGPAWPGPSGEGQAEGAAPAVLSALRRAVSALMEGYENAQRLAIRQEEAARREFVDDLLHGRADRLAERAEHFGLRLAESYVVAVARPAGSVRAGGGPAPIGPGRAGTGSGGTGAEPGGKAVAPDAAGNPGLRDGDPVARRIEEALVARFGSHNVLVAVRDGLLVCVAPGSLSAATGEFTHHVRQAFEPGWCVGVGRAHRGPGGVVASYREAGNAIELGDRLGLRAPVLKAADLLVFPVLLRDREAIDDLVTTVLSPLLEARGGPEPLLDTLEAVFAVQGNQAAAARRLGVSTRAVTYRLERIRRLTGFSPDDPTQRFTLETAVLGARLLDWPAQPLGPPARA